MSNSNPAKTGSAVWKSLETLIAAFTVIMITAHLILRYGTDCTDFIQNLPLWSVLALGGTPLVWGLLVKMVHREFGSDLLAGISIVVSVLLDEYLAGSLVVLMLSGGEALEAYAVRSASSVLQALSKRMPSVAHKKMETDIQDIALDQIAINDSIAIFP
ncbi:MAG: heavy metal translocating P-type ATPase, partial [Gimesia sp.]|nr:heavy metal translocating P-type ATPase [Gimesia sp.]